MLGEMREGEGDLRGEADPGDVTLWTIEGERPLVLKVMPSNCFDMRAPEMLFLCGIEAWAAFCDVRLRASCLMSSAMLGNLPSSLTD